MHRVWLGMLLAVGIGCSHGAPSPARPGTALVAGTASSENSTSTKREPDVDAGQHLHAHGYDKDFSAVQAYAARFDSPERDAWQQPEEVIRLLALRAGDTVADIGAGTGYFLGPLNQAVGPEGHVLALDTEANMVRYMQERAREQGWKSVEVQRVAPDDPGLAAASVDRILIVNTWHHISDRARYAARLRQALADQGAIVVVDFTRESDQGPPPEHRLSPEQVVQELEAGGFEAVIADEALPKQYVVIGKKD